MGIFTLIVTLAILVTFIIFEFKNRNENKIINPSTIFYILWSFILFISVLNLYGLYKPSNEAYLLILLMVIFFFIGNLVFEIIKLKKEKNIEEKKVNNSKTNNKRKNRNYTFIIMVLLGITEILLLLIDCYIVIKNYNEGVPMWQIRRWRMEEFATADNPMLNRRTIIEETFRNVIITPFEMILHPMTAYYFFNKKGKKKYTLLTLSLTILFLSSIAGGGGRLGYIYYFACYLLSYICMMKNNKTITEKSKKIYKRMIGIFLILGVIIVIGFTSIRTNMSFLKQVYKYFALPPTLLSIWLPKINTVKHTCGLLTFFGVHSYIFRAFDILHLNFLIPNIYNETYAHLLNAEKFLETGMGVANAFVTPLYYFYIDGGYIFVCLASLIFGLIVSFSYEQICKKIETRNFIIYLLIVYGIFVSFMRIQTAIPTYIISFILTFLIFIKEEKE